MKPSAFIDRLSKAIPPVIVCSGEESFFKEEVLEAVRDAVRKKSPGYNYQSFEPGAGENDASAGRRLLRDLMTPVLFGGLTLFAVRSGDKLLKEIAKDLAPFLEKDTRLPNRLILFTGKVDGRTKFARKLKESDGLVECKRLYDTVAAWQRGSGEETELSRWVKKRAAVRKMDLNPDAAAFLIELTGNDLFLIDSELAKIRLAGPKGDQRIKVGVKEIEEGTGMSNRHNPFDLWEKIEAGDSRSALKTLGVILRNGLRSQSGRLENDDGSIAAILLGIFRDRVRLSSQVALCQWQRMPENAMMERLKISSKFYLNKLKESARRLTADRLHGMNRALLDAERGIKRRGFMAKPVMEALVIQLSRAGK
jgi:DNA polymerase III delta subunit